MTHVPPFSSPRRHASLCATLVLATTVLASTSACTRTVVLPPTEAVRLSGRHDPHGGKIVVIDVDGDQEEVPAGFEQLTALPRGDHTFMTSPADPTTGILVHPLHVHAARDAGWGDARTDLEAPAHVEIVGNEVRVTLRPDPETRAPRRIRYRVEDLRGVGVEKPDYTVPVVLALVGGAAIGAFVIGAAASGTQIGPP